MDLGVCVLRTEDSAPLQCKEWMEQVQEYYYDTQSNTLYTKQQMWSEGRDIYVGSDLVMSHGISFADKSSWLLLI